MEEIQKLIAGFRRFRSEHFEQNRELYRQLVTQGQNPKTLVIACSDSRVDPAIITDCAPGDLFIVRNVANLVPPCEGGGGYHGTSAALQFAVNFLEVKHIIVIGHVQCGGIKALLHGIDDESGQFIADWVSIAAPAREQVLAELPGHSPQEQQCACEQASVLLSLANLLSFPWIRQGVVRGTLKIHGWYFDLKAGQLLGYNSNTRQFESLL